MARSRWRRRSGEPPDRTLSDAFTLRAERGLDRLGFTFAGAESVTGAVAVDVQVAVEAFTGRVSSVWFQREALDRFEADLRALEQTRSGTAFICNTGVPGATNEVTLTLEARSRGHARLTVSLLRLRHLATGGDATLELRATLDVDGGDLATFAEDWRRLFRERTA